MELQTVQHIDISNAITSVISAEELSACTYFQQDEDTIAGVSYVTVKSMARQPLIQLPSGEPSDGVLNFKVRPLFPGSLLSTEICVYLSDTKGPIEPDNALIERWRLDSGTLDTPLETNLYYRLHAPLPAYLANHPYDTESSLNCIALISHPDALRQVDTILARSLNKQLTSSRKARYNKRKAAIRLYLEADSNAEQNPRSAPVKYHQFHSEQLNHACHRLSIIGKAGLVMCDTAGIAVDALRGGVPAAFINSVPEGFEKMQTRVLEFLQHGDRERLISEQRESLLEIQESLSVECHVLSNHKTLRALLTACLRRSYEARTPSLEALFSNYIMARESSPDTTVNEDQTLVLRTQQTFCSASSKSIRFKSGLASSRRKFQKFKESPSRFMEDSQIRVLRSLVNPRT